MNNIISNNNLPIRLYRGDSKEWEIVVNDEFDCINYVPHKFLPNERLYVSITRPNQKFEDGVIKKILTVDDIGQHGYPVLKFRAFDTEFLEPGTYYFEARLANYNEVGDSTAENYKMEVRTVIPKVLFYII